MVNNDTNSAGLLATDSSLLQLSKSETAAFPDLAVVTNGLSTDSGAEEVKRADTKASGLLLAGLATANLAAGLVKPCTNTDLPVLAEVVIVEDCAKAFSLSIRKISHSARTVVLAETHRLV